MLSSDCCGRRGKLIYCSDISVLAFWYQVNQHSLIMHMMLLSQLQNLTRGTTSISRISCVRPKSPPVTSFCCSTCTVNLHANICNTHHTSFATGRPTVIWKHTLGQNDTVFIVYCEKKNQAEWQTFVMGLWTFTKPPGVMVMGLGLVISCFILEMQSLCVTIYFSTSCLCLFLLFSVLPRLPCSHWLCSLSLLVCLQFCVSF